MRLVTDKILGLAMTGGGARGAYQAGVLKRIGEMPRVQSHGNPFPIIGGASAGAINGTALAAGSNEFSAATKVVARSLGQPETVRCLSLRPSLSGPQLAGLDPRSVLRRRHRGGGNARSLLDASPLRHYLSSRLDCSRIQENIRRGHLYALAISATNYNSGMSYLFIQGKRGHPIWNRSRRVTLSHQNHGRPRLRFGGHPAGFSAGASGYGSWRAYFGDGCLRLQQPLSPIIRLGAEKIFAVGVRCENLEHQDQTAGTKDPSLAQVMGVLFNVMFLDHLATDVEHLERLNQLLSQGHINQANSNGCEQMRPLEVMLVTPSVNLTEVAAHHQKDMPYLIQYFVNGLGRDAASCSDLMSYLLFTSKYTRELIELGYNDADEQIDEIEDYLFAGSNDSQPMGNGPSRNHKSRGMESTAK